MKYNFKIKKETKGYSAECVEIDGIFTQGETIEELESNMKEALNLHLSENDDEVVFKMPQKTKKGWVPVEVEPSVAVALAVRQARLKRKMSQRQMQTFL